MKKTWQTILASLVLLWMVAAMPLVALAQTDSAAPQSYVYRWTASADGQGSDIWRLPANVGADKWLRVGHVPETVEQVVSSAAQPRVAYARTRYALYMTESAGAIWRALPRLPGIPSALAVGQQTPGLLYLGTQTGGAFRSADGGQTWTRLEGLGLVPGAMLEVTALTVNPADDAIVYAASGYWLGHTRLRYSPLGIFLSVDGGATWLTLHQSGPGGARVGHLFADAAHPLRVHAVDEQAARWHTFDDVARLAQQVQAGRAAERAAAAKALGLLGTADAAGILLARLTLEPDAAAGQAVAVALGPLADPAMQPALLAALQHADAQVRWRAATALGYLPDATTVAALGAAVRRDDSLARSAAANALVRIGTAEAAAEVLPLLAQDGLTAARHTALTVLEGIGDPAVDGLAAALADGSATVRRNAAEALGWVASPRAVDALAAALNDADEGVRVQAAWALNAIGTAEAKEALAASIPAAQPAVSAAEATTERAALVALGVGLVALAAYFLLGGRSRFSPGH